MALGAGEASPTSPSADAYGSIVSATLWLDGQAPEKCGLDPPHMSGGVRWFDLSSQASPSTVIELLGSICQGLEQEMLDDLLCRDDIPENRRWHRGLVRLASSFAVYAPEAHDGDGLRSVFPASADAIYEPVEFLAGRDWLLTRWHDACHYRGATLIEDGIQPASREGLREAVAKRWVEKRGVNAGDLGVLAMHELALTYAPTHHRFHMALEEWELNLYGADDPERWSSEKDERRLRDLWGACARLRDWLNPLHIPGLQLGGDKAWLPATDEEEVIAVDNGVAEALKELARLGDRLRSSFQLVHIQKSEEQRERNARLQRRIEILAPVFVVPTLIVGFYGANTWVPGEHKQWGFWVMVGVIVVLTCITASVLWASNRRHREASHRRSP